MTKKETTLMFIKYIGTLSGTAMAKALKDFARSEFNETIIDKSQIDDVVKAIKQHADILAKENPRWKQVEIDKKNSRYSKEVEDVDLFWVLVDEETILTIQQAKGNFAEN